MEPSKKQFEYFDIFKQYKRNFWICRTVARVRNKQCPVRSKCTADLPRKRQILILFYLENRKCRKPLPKIGISKRFSFETRLKYVYRKTKFCSFKNGNIRWKIETVVKFSSISLLVLFRFFFNFLSFQVFFSFFENFSISSFISLLWSVLFWLNIHEFALFSWTNSNYYNFVFRVLCSDFAQHHKFSVVQK